MFKPTTKHTRHSASRPASRTLSLILLAAGTLALSNSPTRAADPAPTGKPDAPLSGPTISQTKKTLSIIQRDADGRVKRLDIAPAEAAVKAMTLSLELRKKADDVLFSQAATLDQIVRDNFDLIVKTAGAFDAKDRVAATRYVQELWSVSEPVRQRGQLVEQISRTLPKAEADQMRSLVREYLKARLKDEEELAKAKGQNFDVIGFNIGETLHTLGQEIRRSYERVIGQGANDFEKVLADLNLTPEQDGKVRGLALDLLQNSGPNTSGPQRFRVFVQAINVLTPEQRKILGEKLSEQRRLERLVNSPDRPAREPADDATPPKPPSKDAPKTAPKN